jgi:hypothetical protein
MFDEGTYESEWEQYMEYERQRYEYEMQEAIEYEYEMRFDELIYSIEFDENAPRL